MGCSTTQRTWASWRTRTEDNGVIHAEGDVDAFTFTPAPIRVTTLSGAHAPMSIQASFGGNTLNSCEIEGDPPQPCAFVFAGGRGSVHSRCSWGTCCSGGIDSIRLDG